MPVPELTISTPLMACLVASHVSLLRALSPSVMVSSSSKVYVPHLFCSASFVKEKEQNQPRRSGNYSPANWDLGFIQSMKNEFTGVEYVERRNLLRERVGAMLDDEEAGALNQLELIHDLQRLGVCYHFKEKIKSILSEIHLKNDIFMNTKDLYAMALAFTLLRQHGFGISQDVFDFIKDGEGNFMENLYKDTKGMLQLYEASYLLLENESGLEFAREFAVKNLKDMRIILDKELALMVQHALELPLHWRAPRVEARWFIDLWEKRLSNKNATLLELAKLDFNILQAIHQEDLTDSARWWETTCLGKNLTFIRDSLVVCSFGAVGKNFEPGFGYFRRMETKVTCLVTTVDDIYDVYGTLDELELFTHVVERWDMEAANTLPDYMKICYLALYNAVNEMAFDTFKQRGFNPIFYLRKTWSDLCNAYLKEAKWYYSGYTPTLEEYLENGWVSVTVPVILVHAYVLVDCPITEEALKSCLHPYHDIIRYVGMIVRLADDLGTSSEELKRGDVPKAMQCYMNDTGASEEEAREYIKFMIGETWKKLNQERAGNSTSISQVFVEIAVNLVRVLQCLYEYGDGHGHTDTKTKNRIRAMFFEHIDPDI